MKFFDDVIKRVVSFPIESYNANKSDIYTFFSKNQLFQLSILTSSRSLYDDVKKNKTDKIKQSLENYFSRAHFNPIPFGTFSSVGSLQWSLKTLITKSTTVHIKVEFDNFFIAEKHDLSIEKEWGIFIYYTNPSIHFLNDTKISFYKSEKLPNGTFETKFVEIDYDENIQWLTARFYQGANISDVTTDLLETGFELSEINTFLFEIIEAGIIISNAAFHPYCKPTYSYDLNSELIAQNIHPLKITKDFENFTQSYIQEQDVFLAEEQIKSPHSHAITSFEENSGQIATDIQYKIQQYIDFTLHYNSQHTPINKTLLKFGNTFYHSFSDGFIPLSTAFNPYCGLKYSTIGLQTESKLHSDIITKIISATTNQIHLSKVKTAEVPKTTANLPPTFTVIFEILNCKTTGKEIVYCKYLGGTSAMNFLSRFNHVTEKTCQDIANFEKEIFDDKIIAEINMISKPRATNIISSHQYYDYNIPLNTVHSKDSNPIFLTDLYVRFNGSSFILASKENQKVIIPRITSAINYSLSDSEIYRFLADLQSQNNEIHHVNFNLNYYKDMLLSFAPRVFLGDDILLYPAQILLVNDNYNFDEFRKYLLEIIKKYSFTTKVSITDEKGEIIINIENNDHIAILHSKIKETNKLYVSECLYESFLPAVKDQSNHYSHELIASVKNTDFKNSKIDLKILENDYKSVKNTPILSDWLYFDLFCNTYAENDLLLRINHKILSENDISQFFFVRYDYPTNHLRVRFKTDSITQKEAIIEQINQLKIDNLILNYRILPYEQEIYRFGGEVLMNLTEKLFYLDSLDTLSSIINRGLRDNEIYIAALFKIKYYLEFFDLTIDEMIVFCENNIVSFSNEFSMNSEVRKEFNKTFSEIRNNIPQTVYDSFLGKPDFKKEIDLGIEKSGLTKMNYIVDVIHMSMNRVFNEKQRFNEFKSYFLTKCYLNQIKFTEQRITKVEAI